MIRSSLPSEAGPRAGKNSEKVATVQVCLSNIFLVGMLFLVPQAGCKMHRVEGAEQSVQQEKRLTGKKFFS